MADTRIVRSIPAHAASPTSSVARVGDRLARLFGVLALLAMAVATYLALVYAPQDAAQGPAQRIFYFHVPSAWLAFLAFFVVLVASVGYLWKRTPGWDAVARSSGEIGLLFTTLMLVTGSIWGKPVWGTWWSWDPMLTTSLILWFIYLGYLMLRAYAPTREQGARYAAVVGIIGFVDVPIVYLATTWWRTLHPEKVIKPEGAAMPGEMLFAFLFSLGAFTLLYIYFMLQRVRIERLQYHLEEREDELAFGGANG
ncbi:MAG: cytochrome c biogenesis protein CcsA [Chloroflexota bacterium]|nr:cytochrome c biogenesis protein CcsA [Chloroflexota bacterium]